jgi:hypothetical protein
MNEIKRMLERASVVEPFCVANAYTSQVFGKEVKFKTWKKDNQTELNWEIFAGRRRARFQNMNADSPELMKGVEKFIAEVHANHVVPISERRQKRMNLRVVNIVGVEKANRALALLEIYPTLFLGDERDLSLYRLHSCPSWMWGTGKEAVDLCLELRDIRTARGAYSHLVQWAGDYPTTSNTVLGKRTLNTLLNGSGPVPHFLLESELHGNYSNVRATYLIDVFLALWFIRNRWAPGQKPPIDLDGFIKPDLWEQAGVLESSFKLRFRPAFYESLNPEPIDPKKWSPPKEGMVQTLTDENDESAQKYKRSVPGGMATYAPMDLTPVDLSAMSMPAQEAKTKKAKPKARPSEAAPQEERKLPAAKIGDINPEALQRQMMSDHRR